MTTYNTLIKEHNKSKDDIVGINSQLAEMVSYTFNATRTKLMNKEPITIVCHGDSMTWGYIEGATQTPNNYPAMLQKKLRLIYEYNDIVVINEGRSGSDSTYGLSSFDSQVVAHNPDLVIMMWGLNDANVTGGNVSLKTYTSNLRQMVKKAKKNNIEVIIASQVPIIKKTNFTNMYPLENLNYTNAMQRLSSEQQVDFVDVYREFLALFKNKSIDNTFYSGGHLADYNIVADIILTEKLAEIYSPKHEANDIINFQTNQVYNNVSQTYTKDSDNLDLFYSVDPSKANEKIKFLVYNNKPNLFLDVFVWGSPSGGNLIVQNYSEDFATISSNSTPSNVNGKVQIQLNNIGLYCLEFKSEKASVVFYTSGIEISKKKSSLFTVLTLQNQWVNFGGDNQIAKISKVNDCMVNITGLLKSGLATDGTIVFAVPQGYAPKKELYFPAVSYDNQTVTTGLFRLNTLGNLMIYKNVNNTMLLLDTISYVLE